jgi:hypothetical protein
MFGVINIILTRKSRFFLRRNVDIEFCNHIIDMGKIHGGNYETPTLALPLEGGGYRRG